MLHQIRTRRLRVGAHVVVLAVAGLAGLRWPFLAHVACPDTAVHQIHILIVPRAKRVGRSPQDDGLLSYSLGGVIEDRISPDEEG